MSKYVPKVGHTGVFYNPLPKPARIEHVWSETCVNLECVDGTQPTSVLVVDPSANVGQQTPSSYYFVPDGKAVTDPIEAEIQAKGLTAPRITPADIEAEISSEHYFTGADGFYGRYGERGVDPFNQLPAALGLLTFCVLVLRNGFTVTGESACASPENFNADIGRKLAREAAINKLYPLLGYELKTKLANEANRVERIARICNDANAAYCAATGDFSDGTWDNTPEAIKESCRDGVRKHLANPDMTPEDSHAAWMAFKAADGYTYGPVRDEATKQHPCMVPYSELPTAQKAKDHIFRAAVHAANRSL